MSKNVVCFMTALSEKKQKTTSVLRSQQSFCWHLDALQPEEQVQFTAYALKIIQDLTYGGMLVDKIFMEVFLTHRPMSLKEMTELYRRIIAVDCPIKKKKLELRLVSFAGFD